MTEYFWSLYFFKFRIIFLRIDEKRNHVLERRAAVKELSQQKWKKLEACKNYREFCAEVDDLRVWMVDKSKTASDESYRDLANLGMH